MPSPTVSITARRVEGDSHHPTPPHTENPSRATPHASEVIASQTTAVASNIDHPRLEADRRRRHLLNHNLVSKTLALASEAIDAIPRIRETLAGPGGRRLTQGQAVSAAILQAARDDWRRKAWAALEKRAGERGMELRDYLRRLWMLDAHVDEDAR